MVHERKILRSGNISKATLIRRDPWMHYYKLPMSEASDYQKDRIRRLKVQHPNIIFYPLNIVWTKKMKSPGYIQETVRPFVQGMGCDGTTDSAIHLLAKTYARRHGRNYALLSKMAYPERKDPTVWVRGLEKLASWEVLIPEKIDLRLLIEDLRDINNYSVADVFEDEFSKI